MGDRDAREELFDELQGPACRVCFCTQERACSEGCGWAREPARRARERSGPICTVCEDLVRRAGHLVKAAGSKGLSWRELLGQLDGVAEDGGRERVARAIAEALLRGDVDARFTAKRGR